MRANLSPSLSTSVSATPSASAAARADSTEERTASVTPLAPPPPRLPSISSLINSLPPPPEQILDDPAVGLSPPRRGSFDDRDRLSTFTASQPASTSQVPSPIRPFRTPVLASPESHSLPEPLARDPPRLSLDEPRQAGMSLSTARYPPSGVSPIGYHGLTSRDPLAYGERQYSTSSPHLPSTSLPPPDVSDAYIRQRSASLNTTYPAYTPPSMPATSAYHRPYPGFATSSERRGSGGDERPPSQGGLGPWRTRRRAQDGPYDFSTTPANNWLKPASAAYSPTRPRALSISAADEYYASRPAWFATAPSAGGPIAHLQPPQRRTESDPFPSDHFTRPFPPHSALPPGSASAGVTSDLAFLRLAANEPQRGPYVPTALPTPGSTGPAPTEVHPELRSLVVPSGMAGSAPSSASSTSNSVSTSQSHEGIPTPISAGPTSSLPSPSTSASTGGDYGGMIDAANDGPPTSENGRYGCPHCTKRFARPSSLRIHTFSHTGEKPFTCPQCERAFSVQSNLRRHLKIHKNATDQPSTSRGGKSRGQPKASTTDSSEGPSSRRPSFDMDEDDAEYDVVEGDQEDLHSLGPDAASRRGSTSQQQFPSVLLR
ncbi:hypothetical protein JCM10212_002600 [Sporobolomyces blumeae]